MRLELACAAGIGLLATTAWVGCGRQPQPPALTLAQDAGADAAPAPAAEGGAGAGANEDAAPAPPGADGGGEGGLDAASAGDGALVFDLGADFSFTANPNGPWRYGFTGGGALGVGAFAIDTFIASSAGDPIALWHPADPSVDAGGYYPYVAENSGSASATEFASWALRPHEVALEASNAGQYAVVQLVAPLAGTYQVQAHFEGIHFRLSTTDVHVLAGDAGLFAADISGYGGDPAFHAVEGSNPSADYAGSVSLQADDVLTFAVGYGTDGTNYNDTTGLTARVVLVEN